VRDDPAVVGLVVRARDGDKTAWDEMVERYAPLLWSICQRYRLSRSDTDDVGQSVWLRLVERLPTLREPAALPGWIATTTSRECLRVLRGAQRQGRLETPMDLDAASAVNHEIIEDELLAHERQTALRTAFVQLSGRCQQLLSLLVEDPPLAYTEISSQLHMPVGSIGPNRARCLDKLRHCPALAALIDDVPVGSGAATTPHQRTGCAGQHTGRG
jgi:RNA polymerase sigma factor (sigma-70 family)